MVLILTLVRTFTGEKSTVYRVLNCPHGRFLVFARLGDKIDKSFRRIKKLSNLTGKVRFESDEMLWHYSCAEELCPRFVRKNGFGVPKTIGITALFRFCGSFPLAPARSFLSRFVYRF